MIGDHGHKKQKEPWKEYVKKIDKNVITILGLRQQGEGLSRSTVNCLRYEGEKIKNFNPLAPIEEDFMDWFIKKYNIKLCELYYHPYNFKRTGCKGCPYDRYLKKDLKIMEKLLPSEFNQCNVIWKKVYDEYKRIGYRLDKEEVNLFNFDSKSICRKCNFIAGMYRAKR